uniref:Uncharacterized protein n=1 Tax=Cacopsylla melanoneura TaxID=428564 RepID=A0A8D8LU65_9HEMI
MVTSRGVAKKIRRSVNVMVAVVQRTAKTRSLNRRESGVVRVEIIKKVAVKSRLLLRMMKRGREGVDKAPPPPTLRLLVRETPPLVLVLPVVGERGKGVVREVEPGVWIKKERGMTTILQSKTRPAPPTPAAALVHPPPLTPAAALVHHP